MTFRFRAPVMAAGAALIAAAAIGVLLGAAPLYADWIVTRQGERFEIKGAWQLKGKLAVFTLPTGTLSSMRADQIDVDASKQATARAKQPAAPQAPAAEQAKPRRRAVIVLTDKDFKKTPLPESAATATPDAAGDAKKGGKDSPPPPGGRALPSSVEVAGWERVPATESKANGVELTGTVRNVSQDRLTEVTVVADLFNENGGLIGRFPAVVDNQLLPPTESSKFHLVAAGVFAFTSIHWETTSKGWKAVQPGPDNAPPARPPGR
jgi:hypothetical protein